MDSVLLVDFANAAWRANMSWGKKEETQDEVMIYNFFRNLRPLVEMFSPQKIFFVLEGHPKHRYALYSEYKANRIVKTAAKQEVHDKFYHNQNEILRLSKYLPITFCRAENYECDDVIATLADNMSQEEINIISNDSDYIQLLQRGYKNCKIYNPIKKTFMQSPKYHYITFKSLKGDPTDNIPGIVAESKAEKLASNPSLLSDWIILEENRSLFSINKQLIEFAKVPEEELEIEDGARDFKSLKNEFEKLDFKSLIKDVTWQKFCHTFDCVTL